MRAIKRRLNQPNPNVQLLTLSVSHILPVSVLGSNPVSAVDRLMCEERRRPLLNRTGFTGVHG
jgi:hypothetical protein